MQPLTFKSSNPEVWERNCTEVTYYKNKKRASNESQRFYTLSFVYTFINPEETIYFAYSYPYTHSQLMNYIGELQISSPHILRCDNLCNTLAGNPCPVLTITQNIATYNSWAEETVKLEKSAAGRKIMRIRESKAVDSAKKKHMNKKGVFVTARVHPGESNASYMVKGLIDYLLSDCKEAALLRKKFVFKIVPMLNPDGVIYGNYRCSLLGVDLNRRWDKPNKTLHPTIYYSKRLLQILTEEHEVLMFCDMHGHSIKKDVFMYGCFNSGKEIADIQSNVFIKLIPHLFSRKNSNFSYKNSKFRIEKTKTSTARVVNFTELNILSSYTLEASFFGCSNTSNKAEHLMIYQLESLGKDLCSVLTHFLHPKELRKQINELSCKLSGKYVEPKSISMFKVEETVYIKDVIKEIDSEMVKEANVEDGDSGGSDSEGSDNDEKRRNFKKKMESRQKKVKSISPIDNANEIINTCTPKPIKPLKEIATLRRSKVRDHRSSSVIKEKIHKYSDERASEYTEDIFKLKSVLHASPIKFTREKIPHDFSLNTIARTANAKKQGKKSRFFEKRNKLQIIDIIKNKLNNLL